MSLRGTLFEIAANNIGNGIQGDLGTLGVFEAKVVVFPSDLSELGVE